MSSIHNHQQLNRLQLSSLNSTSSSRIEGVTQGTTTITTICPRSLIFTYRSRGMKVVGHLRMGPRSTESASNNPSIPSSMSILSPSLSLHVSSLFQETAHYCPPIPISLFNSEHQGLVEVTLLVCTVSPPSKVPR